MREKEEMERRWAEERELRRKKEERVEELEKVVEELTYVVKELQIYSSHKKYWLSTGGDGGAGGGGGGEKKEKVEMEIQCDLIGESDVARIMAWKATEEVGARGGGQDEKRRTKRSTLRKKPSLVSTSSRSFPFPLTVNSNPTALSPPFPLRGLSIPFSRTQASTPHPVPVTAAHVSTSPNPSSSSSSPPTSSSSMSISLVPPTTGASSIPIESEARDSPKKPQLSSTQLQLAPANAWTRAKLSRSSPVSPR